MKVVLFSIVFSIVWAMGGDVAASGNYHFQEGFANSQDVKDKGWVRNCGGSNSESFIQGLFGGTYVPKFDKDANGEDKNLISPEVNGAGTLSFWYKTNSTANRLTLHVCLIKEGVSTELTKISYTEVEKDWKNCSLNINLPSSDKIKICFWAELEEEATATLAIDDISLSQYGDTEPEPDPETTDRIKVNFADAIWGNAIERPAAGAYPSSEINGFKLTAAALITGGRVAMDKQSYGGSIEFPCLKSVEEVDVYANVGTDGNTFALQKYTGASWVTIESIVGVKAGVTVHTIKGIGESSPTKLRIANTSGGTINIYQIITRTPEDVNNLTLLNSSIEENGVCYYNLTHSLSLVYNKKVAAGTGDIVLNSNPIPVSSCVFTNDTVIVPLSLTGSPSGNTAYTLSVPSGAFTESGNPENTNAALTLHFSTYKTVSVPEGYASLIDVAYFDASPAQNRMDIYFPETSGTPVPVVINIHGGGWNHGEKESQTGYNVYFKMGFAVANVEYRMTPHATAPAAIEDIRCALMYLVNNAASLNIDPEKIVLQGGSAGAHLAMTAAYLDQDNTFNPNCQPNQDYKIIAVINKYGPVKLDDFMYYSSLAAWLGNYAGNEEFVKSISPYYLVNPQSAPTYIIHGDADPTVPYEQSERLETVLKNHNVKYQFTTVPGGGHGGFPDEYNTRMNNEITAFLQEILSGTSRLDVVNSGEGLRVIVNDNSILLSLNGDTKTMIYDLSGRLLKQSGEKEIHLVKKGVLLMKVVTNEGVYRIKI